MHFEIETKHIYLKETIKQNIPDKVSINIPPLLERRSVEFEPVLKIFINFSASVSAGIVAS